MTENAEIEALLAEVGPLFDEIERVERLAEDAWLVVFSETTVIEVESDPAGNKLAFSMLLGAVPEERRSEVYPTLLTYSFLKRETGGFHFGMDGEQGYIHLLLDLCRTELTADELAGVLATVLETGTTWRAVIAGEALSDAESDQPADPSAGAIQV